MLGHLSLNCLELWKVGPEHACYFTVCWGPDRLQCTTEHLDLPSGLSVCLFSNFKTWRIRRPWGKYAHVAWDAHMLLESLGSSSLSAFDLTFQLLTNLKRQRVLMQATVSWPPTWQTWVKLPALGFSLAQPWLLPFGEWIGRWKSLSLPFAIQIKLKLKQAKVEVIVY